MEISPGRWVVTSNQTELDKLLRNQARLEHNFPSSRPRALSITTRAAPQETDSKDEKPLDLEYAFEEEETDYVEEEQPQEAKDSIEEVNRLVLKTNSSTVSVVDENGLVQDKNLVKGQSGKIRRRKNAG